MPKLDKNKAKETADAEGFALLDEGIYIGTLQKVTESDEVGPSGYVWWSWEFGDLINVDTDEKAPGRAWANTSMSPDAAWKLKEAFDAFESDPSTDTDELLGQQAQLVVTQRVMERGARKGQLTNSVDQLLPLGAEPA